MTTHRIRLHRRSLPALFLRLAALYALGCGLTAGGRPALVAGAAAFLVLMAAARRLGTAWVSAGRHRIDWSKGPGHTPRHAVAADVIARIDDHALRLYSPQGHKIATLGTTADPDGLLIALANAGIETWT
ncbi:MAG TPA: hypothetical protein VHA73_05320 [Acidimicrobiales bacterium]|jgi:hypothetical protein|nr:hypothetical protein [Acidimicrobiales bacterium]